MTPLPGDHESTQEETAVLLLEGGHGRGGCRRAVLKVGGMTCSNCSHAVERALEKRPEVERCEVDLINEKAIVSYRPSWGTNVSPGALSTAIGLCEEVEDIGFEASVLEDEDAVAEGGDSFSARTTLHLVDEEAPASSAKFLQSLGGVLQVCISGARLKVVYDPTAVGGRTLLKAVQGAGHAAAFDSEGWAMARSQADGTLSEGALRELLISSIFTCLVVIVCWVLPCFRHCQPWLEFEPVPGLRMSVVIMCALATPVQIFSGRRFHVGAFHALKSGVWDMNVLVSLGAGLTFVYSVAVTIFSALAPKTFGYHHCKAPPASYFEAPCMLISFLLVGKTVESWAKSKTREALRKLLALQPSMANLLRGSSPQTIPAELVELGDVLQIYPGEAAPTDGVMVCEGAPAEFDESLLTGESAPVTKRHGDFIIGGSRCLGGRAELKVERVGSRTMLSQITSLMESAQLARAPVQQVADVVAYHFVPCVISIAVVTWVSWCVLVYWLDAVPISAILRGERSEWPQLDRLFFVLEHGLTVLLVACPCAVGLATPTAVMTATGVAAGHGILVRNGAVPLEFGSKVRRVVLDKTGTLTIGKPNTIAFAAVDPLTAEDSKTGLDRLLTSYRQALVAVVPDTVGPQRERRAVPRTSWLRPGDAAGTGGNGVRGPCDEQGLVERSEVERAVWWAIGSAELSSEHPLAKELVDVAVEAAHTTLMKPCSFEASTGMGVSCVVADIEVQVGSATHILGLGGGGDRPAIAEWADTWKADGATVILLAVDGMALAGVALRDALAGHAKACVAELQMAGMEVWMCTGDHMAAAQAVACECGIHPTMIVAEALPGDKVATIKRLQTLKTQDGKPSVVAMVGDGVNDAPALAAADLGVGIGAGHEVTVEAADVVLVRTDLRDLVAFFTLAQLTLRTIWRNFLWAFLFNTCALPVAAGALWGYRIVMTPQIAVCLMLSSSLFVVLSSLSLRSFVPKQLNCVA